MIPRSEPERLIPKMERPLFLFMIQEGKHPRVYSFSNQMVYGYNMREVKVNYDQDIKSSRGRY